MIADVGGSRLDLFLFKHYERFSRTYFQTLIKEGLVLVNGVQEKKRYIVQVGDEIEVEFAQRDEPTLTPEKMSFDILYEDDELLAINKPSGLVVHPGAGNWTGTFVNGLIYYCQQLQNTDSLRPGIVHRLDKETTGVLLAAKSAEMGMKLVELFANRQIEKTYLAVCVGNPGNRLVKNRIGRHAKQRQQMAVVEEGGKEAITKIEVIEVGEKLTTVALFPKTGRTHQLRVHLAHLGCPIVGDKLYGNGQLAERQLLHAYTLSFQHPTTKKQLALKAPLPSDMSSYFNKKNFF